MATLTDERLAEEVLAAEHMGEKRTIGKVVCAECGSDNVVAWIEERTWYPPPAKAAWPVYHNGPAGEEIDPDPAIELAENEGYRHTSDTSDSGWWCDDCGSERVQVVPVSEPAPTVQA